MAHSISRRQFLQGSGAAALSVAAAGLLSSCGGSSASNGGSTGAGGQKARRLARAAIDQTEHGLVAGIALTGKDREVLLVELFACLAQSVQRDQRILELG